MFRIFSQLTTQTRSPSSVVPFSLSSWREFCNLVVISRCFSHLNVTLQPPLFTNTHAQCILLPNVNQPQERQLYFSNQRRSYARHTTTTGLDSELNPSEAAKRKAKGKSATPEQILLIAENQNISVTTLVDAEKLARKKGFQLVEVFDQEKKMHSDKKVYKFETLAQHFGEDWKKRLHSEDALDDNNFDEEKKSQKKKEDKTILLTSKITVHDLEGKVKQLNRLVEKGHPIRVFIGGGGGDPEFVHREIQKRLTPAAKIHQKKTSGTEIRLHILPHTPTEEESKTK